MLEKYARVGEVARFVIAGGLATISNLLLLFVFTELVDIHYIISAVLAYILSTAVSFTLQKFWTFAQYTKDKIYSELWWFTTNNIAGLLFTTSGLYLAVELFDIHYLFAQFVLLGVVALWNYYAYKFLIIKGGV